MFNVKGNPEALTIYPSYPCHRADAKSNIHTPYTYLDSSLTPIVAHKGLKGPKKMIAFSRWPEQDYIVYNDYHVISTLNTTTHSSNVPILTSQLVRMLFASDFT